MATSFEDELGPAFSQSGPIAVMLGEKQVECPEHGPYLTRGTRYTVGKGREVWTPCERCTQAAREAEEAEALAADQRRRQERLVEAVGRAAIPLRFRDCRFGGYRTFNDKQWAVRAACVQYAKDFDKHRRTGESLVLIGKRGTGKTHLATAILHALLPDHVGLYTTAQDMIAMIRATWGGAGSTDAVMKVLYGVPLLVIDEIGVQGSSENEKALVFQVLDHRYRERKPVVLVGNMGVADMAEVLGDRIFDRLREIAQVQTCEWGSYRSEARKSQG